MSDLAALAEELLGRIESSPLGPERPPLATYRLQLRPGFGFKEAASVVPYLARLGVSDLYLSPIARAVPGSTHGYDVVDSRKLNPDLGTEEDFEALVAALFRHGMGQILDLVVNHMGNGRWNAWWMDVLENGPASAFASTFDIEWHPVKAELAGKVLLPVLDGHYGEVLEAGHLKLIFRDGALFVHYGEELFPVNPEAYALILTPGLGTLEEALGREDPAAVELESILTALAHLPPCFDGRPGPSLERAREKEVIKRRLAALVEASPPVADFVRKNIELFNGKVGDPKSFDAMDELLGRCAFRLANWKVAGDEINYRRFFDISSLAAIRVEEPEVFEAVHELPFRLLEQGKVTGFRIDHPDGLFDPTAYFLKLQERHFLTRARRRFSEDYPGREDDWPMVADQLARAFGRKFQENPASPLFRALYVVVEKIQRGLEQSPDAWAIHGTTGYRFTHLVGGLFVDANAEAAMTRAYERFTGLHRPFEELLYEKKELILSAVMASEVNLLARELSRIAEMNRRTRDFTLTSLGKVLTEYVALFPVYRTYVDGWRGAIDGRDVEYVQSTLERAKARGVVMNATIFDFLGEILLRRYAPHVSAAERAVMLRFAMRLQQLTGPVMAKALEDTVFYTYNRLVSLNEVGGEPETFGVSVATFHAMNLERSRRWPLALITTATHDTKRGEDVRARLHVLSEVPEEWERRAARWSELNRRHKGLVGGRLAPDSNDEYLFYQTLVGAWPMGGYPSAAEWETLVGRLRAFFQKAIKEAKVNTSWVNPNPAYESATDRFVQAALLPARSGFLDDVLEFKLRIEPHGQLNSLSQLVLKLGAPGAADTYQGSELWDLSLVDPDNRRPVDFSLRAGLLRELDGRAREDRVRLCRELTQDMGDGRVKLFALSEGLRLRQRRRELFLRGGYHPVEIQGPRTSHAVGFWREHEGQWVGAIVPRLTVRLLGANTGLSTALQGTHALVPKGPLGPRRLVNVFTGTEFRTVQNRGEWAIDLGGLFKHFPVALLENREE